MTRTCLVAIVVLAWTGGLTSLGAEQHPACPHVRASVPRIREAVSLGLERSETFRSLVQEINASDGLVMIEAGACRSSVRACLYQNVVVAPPHRVLQILVVPRKAPGCQLVESIGHELYHAVEVLREPGVRNFRQLISLYQRIGAENEGRFETNGAVKAGRKISTEACP